MAESKLKVSRRNTFTFEGHAIVNKDTFTINKTKEDGSWVHNALNMGVDCGPDHGVNYVSLMGGYAPNRDNNIIYLSTIDENGQIQGKEHQLQIAWENRLSLTEEDFQKIHSSNVINTYLERGSDGKAINKKFISAYDAIAYIKEFVTDKSVVHISGHMEYRPSNETEGEWFTSHIIDSITLKDEDRLIYRATAKIAVLTDKDTMGKPNDEDKTVPLYMKTLSYVRSVNGKKYNQTCVVPVKAIFDYSNKEVLQGKNAGQMFELLKNQYFSCEKTDMVDETVMNFFYRGGVKKVTAKFEDLPQDIQMGIKLGVIDEEQALGNLSIGGTAPRDLVFFSVETIGKDVKGDGDVTLRTSESLVSKCKYATSELLEFSDLEPIDTNGVTAPVDTSVEIDDEKVNEEVASILSMFNTIG